MGCYAMTPDDYTKFAPFFKKAIGDYHKDDPEYGEAHVNDWDASPAARKPELGQISVNWTFCERNLMFELILKTQSFST